MATQDLYIGVDVGGSHVSVGIVDTEGTLVLNEETPIKDATKLLATDLVESIVHLIQQVMNTLPSTSQQGSSYDVFNMFSTTAKNMICGIGVCTPGQSRDGVLVAASNFPLLKDAHLVDMLHGYAFLSAIPIILLNDGDAAVSAELWAADSRDSYNNAQNVAMITLGTGIGVGLVLNGRLFQGGFGCVEGGHMIIDSSKDATLCGCGQRGCVEVYSSAGNISRLYEEELKKEVNSEEKQEAYSGHSRGSQRVFEIANSDPTSVASDVLDESCRKLAILIINLCRVVDPTYVILGGGMSKAGNNLLSRVNKYVKECTWSVLPTDVNVVLAKGSSNSGTIGAALAAKTYANNSISLMTATSNITPKTSPLSRISFSDINNFAAGAAVAAGLGFMFAKRSRF